MTATIKITSLGQMGNVIPESTVVPVVDMTGTPLTKKATFGNIANAILSQAGIDYAYAAYATNADYSEHAGAVTESVQANITGLGTLTELTVAGQTDLANLTVTGLVNLGDIESVSIMGGNFGEILSTDGNGMLSWVAGSGGSSNPGGATSQVQFNDSGVFNGTAGLTFNKTTNSLTVTGNVVCNNLYGSGNSNVVIVSHNNEYVFSNDGALSLPDGSTILNGGLFGSTTAILGNTTGDVQVYAQPTGVGIQTFDSTDYKTWFFDNSGIVTLPGGVATIGVSFDIVNISSANGVQLNCTDGQGSTSTVATDQNSAYLSATDGNSYSTLTVTSSGVSITGPASVLNLNSVITTGIQTYPVSFADLPAKAIGLRAFLLDGNLVAANNFGSVVGVGGSNLVPVYSDGVNWLIG